MNDLFADQNYLAAEAKCVAAYKRLAAIHKPSADHIAPLTVANDPGQRAPEDWDYASLKLATGQLTRRANTLRRLQHVGLQYVEDGRYCLDSALDFTQSHTLTPEEAEALAQLDLKDDPLTVGVNGTALTVRCVQVCGRQPAH